MRRFLALAAAALVVVGVAGCGHPSKVYDTQIELSRVDIAQTDDKGTAQTLDVEFTWTACNQREVIRGDAKFAECMKKQMALGTKLPVKVEWHWDKGGFYDWDIIEMGGCKRPYEDDDNASFDTVQECSDAKEHGAVVGFRCNRIPEAELLQKCPWFKKH